MASLFICTLFSSCALLYLVDIDLGGNDYADLNTEELKRVKDVKDLNLEKNFNYDGNLYEVDSSDIEKIIKSESLVWVHTWRPFCSAKECQFIEPFQAKAKQYNIKLFMISETYDFNSLDTIAKRANYEYPFFVVSNKYYGSKIDKSNREFSQDILRMNNLSKKEFYGDFLFKDGRLIYKGNQLLGAMDSVLQKSK